MPLSIRDGSSWKTPVSLHVRDSGAWKRVLEAWVRDSGAWKLAFIAAEWVQVDISPPAIDSANAIVRLHATYGNSLTVKVEVRYDEGSGYGSYTDVTSLLSPVPGTPPTSLTSYSLPTPYKHVPVSGDMVTAQIRATILSGSVVVDQIEVESATWEMQPL